MRYFFVFIISKDIEPLCSNDKCEDNTQFIPDPRNFGLTEDFIFIEDAWGSMFYKYIGKQTREEAKRLCHAYGDLVHLPIPRFKEENEFYRKHFADETLWLDISREPSDQYQYDLYEDNHGHYKSSFGQMFVRRIKTLLKNEYVENYDWINFTKNGSDYVILAEDGHWETTNENIPRNSVCVFNMLLHENCSNCPDEAFCRFTTQTRQETECVCPIDRDGEMCQNNLCSHCENGGYCKFYDDDSNQLDCVCPIPFNGENCTKTEENCTKNDPSYPFCAKRGRNFYIHAKS